MTHEERLDARKLKTANKIMGRQGQTIFELRARLAEALSLVSKSERGELRRLERVNQEHVYIRNRQDEVINQQRDRIKELEADLADVDRDLAELNTKIQADDLV
jgi:hypothetical protein